MMVYLVAGARPNFAKIAPIVRAIKTERTLSYKIVDTGQHYDREMNTVFFEELEIPAPDFSLNVGSGGHAEQTAKIMIGFEKLCLENRPDIVIVVGDVNSTLACTIAAKKCGIPVAHVEAGLRSGDRSMPEEINRIVTDSICDWFFVTEPSAVDHLRREGKPDSAVFFVGHVMIDNLLFQSRRLSEFDAGSLDLTGFKAAHQGEAYGVVTLHRPSNVDDIKVLTRICRALNSVAVELPLIFSVHPRTKLRLAGSGITLHPRISLVPPQSYLSFLNLWKDAAVVLTDSGGLQEETTALGVPCVTLRNNTERPITVTEGSNILAGTDPDVIIASVLAMLKSKRSGRCPLYWDGLAAQRIVNILMSQLCSTRAGSQNVRLASDPCTGISQ